MQYIYGTILNIFKQFEADKTILKTNIPNVPNLIETKKDREKKIFFLNLFTDV